MSCPPHHWRIEEAITPVSEGSCLKCGESRCFKNGYTQTLPAGGDGLHFLFMDEKKNWAAEWVSEKTKDTWSW